MSDNCTCLGFPILLSCPVHGEPPQLPFRAGTVGDSRDCEKKLEETVDCQDKLIEKYKKREIIYEEVRAFYGKSSNWQELKTDLITPNRKGEAIFYICKDLGIEVCEGGEFARLAEQKLKDIS